MAVKYLKKALWSINQGLPRISYNRKIVLGRPTYTFTAVRAIGGITREILAAMTAQFCFRQCNFFLGPCDES